MINLFAEWRSEIRSGVAVSKIEAGAVVLGNGERMPSDLIAVVGPLRGPSIAMPPGMTDLAGFVTVDAYLRSPSEPSIFAAGDVATMPGPTWPKTWAFSVRQASAVATNVVATLDGRPLSAMNPSIAKTLSRISLPDLGGRAFLIIDKRPILLGKLPRRIRLGIDRKHFRTYSPGDTRWREIPR